MIGPAGLETETGGGGGKTVGDVIMPQIAASYRDGKPMQLQLTGPIKGKSDGRE